MPNVNYLSTSTAPVHAKEVKSQVENFKTPHSNLNTELGIKYRGGSRIWIGGGELHP